MLTRKKENHQWRRSSVGHEYSWLVQKTDDDDSSAHDDDDDDDDGDDGDDNGGDDIDDDDDDDDDDDTTISFRHVKIIISIIQLGFDKYIDPLKTYLSKYRDSVKGTTCVHIYLYLYHTYLSISLSVCLSF